MRILRFNALFVVGGGYTLLLGWKEVIRRSIYLVAITVISVHI